MSDYKKKPFVLTPDDVADFESLREQLAEFRQKCQDVLAPLLLRHGVDVDLVNFLDFQELTKSFLKRKTDAAIMEDDLQRFRLYSAAVRLVTKSTDEEGHELSEQIDLLIADITRLMCKVLRENGVLPPDPPQSENLEMKFDKTTRKFLEVVREGNKENAMTTELTAEMTLTAVIIEEDFTDNGEEPGLRAICDVRNYVIVRDLRNLLIRFQRDLGHLSG